MKPKRAPPKGLGQRPAKKKPAEDAEMANEEVKEAPAPPKKAPPALGKKPALSSDKPKTVASSSKGPTAPVIQEEDLGAGLSKEDAIEKA